MPHDTQSSSDDDRRWSLPSYGQVRALFLSVLLIASAVAMPLLYTGITDRGGTALAAAADQNWTYNAGGSIGDNYDGITVDGDTLYAGSDDGTLHAVNRATGNEYWTTTVGGKIDSTPTIVDDLVILGTDDSGQVKAYDKETGTEEWAYSTGGNIDSSPTVANGTVFVGSSDNNLHAIDSATGSGEWSFSTGGDVTSSPTVDNGIVYFGSNDNNLYAVDSDTGSEVWSYNAGDSVISSPTVGSGSVFVGTLSGGNQTVAVDKDTGEQQWTKEVWNDVYSSPTYSESTGLVYIGSMNNYLYAVDADTGSGGWSYEATDSISSSPTVSNGVVYFGDESGTAHAIDASSGSGEWTKSIGSTIESSPTVAEGIVYFGDYNGDVTALETSHSGSSDGSRVTSNTLGYNSYSTSLSWTRSVTGTVTDTDGNALENADISISDQSDGSTVFTDTTDTNGQWSTTLSDGDYEITASKTNYAANTTTFTVSGSSITVNQTLSQPTVSGQVTTQNGDPVANATAHLVGVNYTALEPPGTQSLEDRANELIDEAENPLPPMFDRSLDVKGEFLSNGDQQVPLVYTRDDIATTPWQDSADLQPPNVVLPADEPIVFTPWDPAGSAGLLGNEYSNQLPGTPADPQSVAVYQLGPDGSVTNSQAVEIDKTVGGGLTDPSSLPYGEVRLSPGIYRISLQNSDASYLISVGNPDQLAGAISDDLRDKKDQLSERAQAIRDRFTQDKFTATTVETNATGHYSAEVGSNVGTVAVEAYKSPDVPIDPASDTHPRTQIRNYAADFEINSSIYLPSQPRRYDVPNQNADLELREVSYTPYENSTKLQDRLENLEQLLGNETQRLESVFQQANASRQELESVYGDLENVTENNDELRTRVDELLNQDRETQIDVSIDPDNATDSDLRQRIAALEQAIQEGRDTLPSDSTETTIGEETIDAVARFPGSISQEQVTVLAHYSNGTTKTVSDEYLSVDSSAGTAVPGTQLGTTAIQVEDYPVGTDAANVQFEWVTARSDGVGRATTTANNPLVNADAPGIDSVAVSSLAPGPDDRVSVEVNPSEESNFRELASATVYGPDGTIIPTENITDGRETAFTTNGQGTHTVQLTYTDLEGNEFTKTVRLGADTTDRPRPASIRAESGPTGVYGVVGDGLEDGDVSVSESGDLSVSAEVSDTESPPSEIHVYTGAVDTEPTGDVTARLVGEDGAALNHRAWVYVHGKATPEDGTYIYRNGNQPVTTGEGNQFGTVTHKPDQSLIRTYTGSNGEVSVTITQPTGPIDSAIEAARWQYRQFTAGFDGTNLIPFGIIGLGLFTRRRRNRGASQ